MGSSSGLVHRREVLSLALGLAALACGDELLEIDEGGAGVTATDLPITSARLFRATVDRNHPGFSGEGFINFENVSDSAAEWTIDLQNGGTATAVIRYANGSSGSRPMSLRINDGSPIRIELPGTGSWSTWAESMTAIGNVPSGRVTVRLESANPQGGPNVDTMRLDVDTPSTTGGGSGPTGGLSAACRDLVNNPETNWNETSLSEQEIVRCLSDSLGRPVGYGENARGGFNPGGTSRLVVINRRGSEPPEAQLLRAIGAADHKWIVFDKDDFRTDRELAMYRLSCSENAVRSALGGASEVQCRDHRAWCQANGIAASSCASTFFNGRLNRSLPIRNPVVRSNTTIDGRGSNVNFLFSGFAIDRFRSGSTTQTANNVIITNLTFEGAGHVEDHLLDPDMLRVENGSYDVWIHKNSFIRTGDSAFDVKDGANRITMSFNRIVDVLRASLHGSSDGPTDNARITTTMHNNLFVTSDAFYSSGRGVLRRVPLLRRGASHMFNNVFVDYWRDIASVRVGGTLLWEDNMFVGTSRIQAEGTNASSVLTTWESNLTDRVVTQGTFSTIGSVAQFASNDCRLNPSFRTTLAVRNNDARDLKADYSDTSRSTITSFRLAAGQELVDYVNRTAGSAGATPFNSPLAASIRDTLLGAGPNCKN